MRRLFAHDSIWNRPLADNAPLSPDSAETIGRLAYEIQEEKGIGIGPWYVMNARYTLMTSVPGVPVALSNPTAPWRATLAAAFQSGVPIPSTAQPTPLGGDNLLSVWDQPNDMLWELYQAAKDPATGAWTANWGGLIQGVSRSPGYFNSDCAPGGQANWGAGSMSLPVTAGMITYAEAKDAAAGNVAAIQHTLTVNVPWTKPGVFAWPAQRHDSTQANSESPFVAGSRIRIDPTVVLTTLGLGPFQLAIANALQRYGMVICNQTGRATGIAVEDPAQYNLPSYPWFGPASLLAPSPNVFFSALPWARMQVLAMDLYSNQIV